MRIRVRKDLAPHLTDSERVICDVHLLDGTVVEMLYPMQRLVSHEIPRRNNHDLLELPAVKGVRINLTGRCLSDSAKQRQNQAFS